MEADSLTIIDLEKQPRRAPFFKSSPGQKLTTGCAYAALTCLVICLLLTDYTRLAFPIGIAVLPLIFLGSVSSSSRRLVLVAFALWGILVQTIGPGLLNLGEQATDINQLRGQLIQLENQRNQLRAQENELGQQLTIFFEIKDEPSLQEHPLGDAVQTTVDAIAQPEVTS